MCLQLWQNSPLNPPSSRLPKRCKAAVGETLRAASGPLPGVWPGAKRGASLPQHPISTSFSFTLLDLITLSLYIKFTPSAQPPRRRKHQFLRWLLGSFKLIWMKFVNLRTDLCWEKGFFSGEIMKATQIDALSTLIGKWGISIRQSICLKAINLTDISSRNNWRIMSVPFGTDLGCWNACPVTGSTARLKGLPDLYLRRWLFFSLVSSPLNWQLKN